ncbi:hypothetical protein GCM10011341_39600 [Frigidibacter albus]|uniref:hypothetical protein n=1 Tax=Frigidibacter albus TaxID=1465486 RepID=UPI0013D0E7F6|nr:hypothetical protein [Frigidibacter albus]GGH63994.1 hypothetical protein GCM10011341_39600 [Frigidibacter albus]
MARETAYPVKKLVNLTEEQAARISDFRFDQRLQSENEAIRRLLEIALDKAGDGPPAD